MLSVVIPSLNEEGYLEKLLQDLQNQTCENFEVVVADSHSDDDTSKIAKRFGCKLVQCPRRGPGHGRNMGASRAKGENILFLDADVRLQSDHFLERMLDKVQRENIRLGTFPFVLEDGMGFENLFAKFIMECVNKFNHIFALSPGFCTFVSRDIHERVGGYREDIGLGEDHNYVKRASEFAELQVMKGLTVKTSTRRQEREGRVRLYKKYIHCWLHRILNGPMDTAVFNYSFGDFSS